MKSDIFAKKKIYSYGGRVFAALIETTVMKRALIILASVFLMLMAVSANSFSLGDEEPLLVYPNPADNYLQVDFASTNLNIPEIRILDLTGKVVKKFDKEMVMENGVYKSHLDISELSQGIYFVKLLQGKEIFTKKLVVR